MSSTSCSGVSSASSSSSSVSSASTSIGLGHFKGRSVLALNQFNRAELERIFALAYDMKRIVEVSGSCDLCKGRVMATLFYEPSTRTSSSFQAAMLRLGGGVVPLSDVMHTSSAAKGETLEDTVRTLESYVDIIAMRHPEIGSAARAAAVLKIPLLNGGDGAGEHPTQAMLDAFSMLNECGSGKLDGLSVTLLGDLKYGRTVHSLVQLLKHFNVTLHYVCPDFLSMPQSIVDELKASGISQSHHTKLDDVLAQTDVLYVTRIQKERFTDMKLYEEAANLYRITPSTLEHSKCKPGLVVLHPLPRVNEIDPALDTDPRAAYFRQMRYGLFVRMALIALVLGKA